MKEIYREAFVEISEIFKLMPNIMLDKIPNKFKQIIENEKSTTYTSNIKEPLEQCILKEETIIVLSLIYRDFLCDKEEKARLQYRDAQKIKEAENELRERYNTDNIFKNKVKTNIDNTTETRKNLSLVKYEEDKWYKKIFSIIKRIFKR